MEYKRELPGGSDGNRKEFCADVSCLANSAGGHLIFGVDETDGCASVINSIRVPKAEEEVRRLTSMTEDGIQPRIQNMRIKEVPLDDGGHVFVVRVPKSWNPPHMVTMKKDGRFYGRNSKGKYRLDVDDLRAVFGASEAVTERMKRLRTDRVAKALAGETPVPLRGNEAMLLHVVPLTSVVENKWLDLDPVSGVKDLPPVLPVHASSSYRFNLDGFLTYESPDRHGSLGYTQVFRSGVIEGAESGFVFDRDGKKHFDFETIQSLLLRLPKYLETAEKIGCGPPYVIFVTFVGVEGVLLEPSPARMRVPNKNKVFDRDVLPLPEVMIREGDDIEPKVLLRPVFDALWNAAGYSQCWLYDKEGNWTG